MKKVFQIFLLAMLVLTSCNRNNFVTFKVASETIDGNYIRENLDEFLVAYDEHDGEMTPTKIGINGRRVKVSYPMPILHVGIEAVYEFEIPNSVKELGIYRCPSLTHLEIPNSVKELTIYNCPSLTSLEIPDSATDVEISGDCASLNKVTFPKSASIDIDEWRFVLSSCNSLQEIKLPVEMFMSILEAMAEGMRYDNEEYMAIVAEMKNSKVCSKKIKQHNRFIKRGVKFGHLDEKQQMVERLLWDTTIFLWGIEHGAGPYPKLSLY